jgi:RNA polymerase sigma-70 factor (ECF subfamily)
MRIAINLVRDYVRRKRFRFWQTIGSEELGHGHDWADPGLSPEDRVSLNEQVEAVWRATKALSTKQRTIFLLRFVEDMEILEIAQATGLTENAVHANLFRAVRSIRKRLGGS